MKMSRPHKKRNILRRYRNEEDGNVAVLFGVSAVAIIGLMGAGLDFATLSSAKSRSQSIADQTALLAAVYVRDNGGQPTPTVGSDILLDQTPSSDNGYLDKSLRTYTAAELGYEYKGWVEGGAENVTVELEYDEINGEIHTTVSGKTKPTFIQILGKQDMSFAAKSTAKYADLGLYDPASVLMVLDNSGSMAFDDKPLTFNDATNQWEDQDNAVPRIDALIQHSKNFFTLLHDLVGEQNTDKKKILRTGMLSYNSGTLSARSVAMNWSIQSSLNSLNNMVADGGTNSAPSLSKARSWMAGEDKNHLNMHGEDPVKYVVFMSDGLNTEGGSTWVAEKGTGQWYGERCVEYHKGKKSGTCKRYGYDTVESETRPSFGSGWEEGKWASAADIASIADCKVMKNEGVKIYTIGFALAEGLYDTNGYYGYPENQNLDKEVRDQAYSFLTQCASDPETFLTAENASELEEAFKRIGNDIMTEMIRLSN